MKYDNMTPAQKDVFNAAYKRIKRKPWFRGVCMDNYPSDEKCRENREDAISSVIMETMYWDAPNGIFG